MVMIESFQGFGQTGRIQRNIPAEIFPAMNKINVTKDRLAQGMYIYSLRVSNTILTIAYQTKTIFLVNISFLVSIRK
jgi:hypothetical protein